MQKDTFLFDNAQRADQCCLIGFALSSFYEHKIVLVAVRNC